VQWLLLPDVFCGAVHALDQASVQAQHTAATGCRQGTAAMTPLMSVQFQQD
jgi:hypothetical protein